MHGGISTIAVTAEDESFLYEVYVSTRKDEVAAWGWDKAQQEAFLRMQFTLQRRSYAQQYPEADHRIIVYNGQSAGQIQIIQSYEEIKVADITLMPDFRNFGIGSTLIVRLQEQAKQRGVPLRLSVLKTNVARRLYERLGFTITGEHGMHFMMEWRRTGS